MTEGLHIDPASMKNLSVNFKRFQAEVLQSSVKGLQNYGWLIIGRAKRNLEKNGNVATGLLRNSGRAVVQPDNTVDAGFYAAYAVWVEEGRNGGGMPPVDDIQQWLVKKHIDPGGRGDLNQRRRAMAWAIAKHIAEHGTKAKPFLRPAYEEYRLKIAQFMQRQVNACCEKYKKK